MTSCGGGVGWARLSGKGYSSVDHSASDIDPAHRPRRQRGPVLYLVRSCNRLSSSKEMMGSARRILPCTAVAVGTSGAPALASGTGASGAPAEKGAQGEGNKVHLQGGRPEGEGN